MYDAKKEESYSSGRNDWLSIVQLLHTEPQRHLKPFTLLSHSFPSAFFLAQEKMQMTNFGSVVGSEEASRQ